ARDLDAFSLREGAEEQDQRARGKVAERPLEGQANRKSGRRKDGGQARRSATDTPERRDDEGRENRELDDRSEKATQRLIEVATAEDLEEGAVGPLRGDPPQNEDE